MQVVTFDFILLVTGVFVLSQLKKRSPDLFFLAKGVNIFLAPQEELEEDSTEPKKKRSKKTKTYPLRITEAELNTMKEFPLYNEYEKLFMLGTLLFSHWLITTVISYVPNLPPFFTRTSTLPYYLVLLLTLYATYFAWKVATHNGLRSLEIKVTATVTLVVVGLYWLVQTFLPTQSSISLPEATQSLNSHLNILFVGHQIFINSNVVFVTILFLSGVMIFVTIPAVMKYGNIYTHLLKQAYLSDPMEGYSEAMKIAKEKVKLKSKKELKILNVELTLGIALLICWGVPPVREQIPDVLFWSVLSCLVVLMSYISLITFKEQIELTMHNAYAHIKKFQADPEKTEELLKFTQRKVESYIYLFWYPSLQFLFKLIVPILLLMMASQRPAISPAYEDIKYHYQITPSPGLPSTKINLDSSCGFIPDPLLAIKHIYHCSRTLPSSQLKSSINGWQTTNSDSSLSRVLTKVSDYGLFPSEFLREFWSQVLWLYLLSKYALTLVYILFLRKTVHEY